MPRPDLAARIPQVLARYIARCFLPPGTEPPHQPTCSHPIAPILETRTLQNSLVRRRFECAACGHRWTTYGPPGHRHQKLSGRSRHAHDH